MGTRRSQAGFSLPLVLIGALVVVLGGLMLANRGSDGLLSVAFQRDSIDARDAAETGFTRILGELNRPRNRGLLAKAGSDVDSSGYLWPATEASASASFCPNSNSDLTSANSSTGLSLGYSNGSYGWVYLGADGQRLSSANGLVPAAAVKAYRLLWVDRQPLRDAATGKSTLRIFQSSGRGRVRLAVEGMALRGGQAVGTARLEKELQLVPKCCGVPFGGAHGTVDYGPDAAGRSICIPAGWGFVAGAAQTDTGSLTINGVSTIVNDASPAASVNPLLCIATSAAQCSFNPTSTSFTLQPVPPLLPPVPEHPVAGTPLGTIDADTAPTTPDTASAGSSFLRCSQATTATVASLKGCPGKEVTINASATALPSSPAYCLAGDHEPKGAPDGTAELHCNLAVLDYGQLTLTVEGTATRPLRFYFPATGDVVRATGSATLSHAVGSGGDATDFSLFGCRTCTAQTVKLAGGAAGLELFAWFPKGSITVGGSASYTGVVWANSITSNGGVSWTVPAAAVAAALKLAGFGLEGELNPPNYDWVARSTRSFRWFGQ
jgi:hypothetical protein